MVVVVAAVVKKHTGAAVVGGGVVSVFVDNGGQDGQKAMDCWW